MAEPGPLTARIARFALETRLDDLPPTDARLLPRLVADALVCGLATRGEPQAELLAAYARRRASRLGPWASLLVGGGQTDAALAALANGAAIRMLDANDIYCPPARGESGGHFSDVVGALLAAAEVAGQSGSELLAAIAVAYEIQALLAVSPGWRAGGLHAVSLISWAIPPAAARLWGLSLEQTISAIAISGITGQANPTWLRPDRPVTAMKAAGPGLLSLRAVEAVELAREGINAPDEALELMLRKLGQDPAELPTERLGRQWTLGRNLIKRYPAQFYTQGAIQAAAELWQSGLRADQVAELTISGHAGVCGMVQGSPHAFRPESQEDADHSTPFVTTMALLRGQLTPAEYRDEPWLRPDVRALMDRIRLVQDPRWQQLLVEQGVIGCRMEARLRDGSSRALEVRQPLGHPEAPMTDQQLLEKHAELLAGRLGSDGAAELLAACDRLRGAASLNELLEVVQRA